ncbi:MAG TPA: succinyldiaminopimelate transaminase [Caldimonas sp.]|nr:succinyldiaminopimelate transaminase [Caldimonas sp.]
MNPRLERLHPYPFERLRALTADLIPDASFAPIDLGIGEPKHPTPAFIGDALVAGLDGLARYPATAGDPALREAMADWVRRRYGVALDPATQVLPVNGSREALFAFAQTVVDATRPHPTVVCPNPFYQIYEGAALLAGARAVYANAVPARGHAIDWSAVDPAAWEATQLLFVCSPHNPTGAVATLEEWRHLFELADRHGFVIASDECYSEIWFRDTPPLGALEAAHRLGRHDLRNLVMFTSLSKRSNVPGMRSGFVAGDATAIKRFLLYRTYHGSAMSPAVQNASVAAWSDEAHVEENRRLYRAKFEAVVPILREVLDVDMPEAAFYLWLAVPGGDDVGFARALRAHYNLGVLPGSLLAREAHGTNPGAGRVRLALVAPLAECVEAAQRIARHVRAPRPA